MLTDRAFPFHRWIEVLAWVGLAGLAVLVQILPLPAEEHWATDLFLLVLAFYLLATFRWLFPRTHYAPNLIYLSLILDVLIVGVLRLFLADYVPNSELAFMPLIIIAAMVADRRGVIVLAFTAGVVDVIPELLLTVLPRAPLSAWTWLNQLGLVTGFALTGLVVLLLTESVRKTARESDRAAAHMTQFEKELRHGAERTARRWEILTSVSIKVQRETRPADMYAVMVRELGALELSCLVMVWDEPGQTLRIEYVSLPAAAQAFLEHLIGISTEEFRLKVQEWADVNQMISERRGQFMEVTQEMLGRALPPLAAGTLAQVSEALGVSRLVGVPLLAGENVLGLFGVWGRDLTGSDVPAIMGLAQQVAVALEKAQLLEREQKRSAQLAFVSEIAGRAVGLMDADELLHEVTRLMVLRFGFENASIFLNDVRNRQVYLVAHAGRAINQEELGYRQSWETGLIGLAARTGTTVLSNDVRHDPRYHTADPHRDICRAELAVPLKRGDETLGAFDVQNTMANAFEPADVVALETLAAQIAAALVKGELLGRERKRAAQLAMVSAIAERATATLDADRLLDQVVGLICERFGYHYVAVMLLDPATGELVMRASAGGYANIFAPDYRQKPSVGLIGEAARTGTTVISNDVQQDTHFFFPEGQYSVARSEMSVPLKIGNRILGVFDVHSLPVNAFDASDVAAMETLANQIAIALENARLYAQTRDDAEVKAALLRELSHRVKNNLASIVGLLYLGLDDETIPRSQILNETITRVQSMAAAHTLLSNSPQARVDTLELGRRVLADSTRQMALPGTDVNVQVAGDAVDISARQASSLALVLNELVTNAIKHGSPDRKELRLTVSRVAAGAQLEFSSYDETLEAVEVEDADEPTSGLGLQLVRTLVEKDLGGTLQRSPTLGRRGFVSVICFDPED